MSAELDLFASYIEPTEKEVAAANEEARTETHTCGTCGACMPTRLGPTGLFCDLSLMDIKAEGTTCGWWYPRAKP
jgi:hypothetical protein